MTRSSRSADRISPSMTSSEPCGSRTLSPSTTSMRRPPEIKLFFVGSRPQGGETPACHASIRTRRGAPKGARCILGSDPAMTSRRFMPAHPQMRTRMCGRSSRATGHTAHCPGFQRSSRVWCIKSGKRPKALATGIPHPRVRTLSRRVRFIYRKSLTISL